MFSLGPRSRPLAAVSRGLALSCNHIIWKSWFGRVRATCCFGRWMQSLFFTLLQLGLRSQSLCGLWFASVSIFLSSWNAVSVSESPWNGVYYVLWVTASKFLFVSFESMYLPVGDCSRVGKTLLFGASTLRHFGLCTPQVSISCHSAVFRNSVGSFENQVGLGLSPWRMDKYLWEHVQIFLSRDDLLCLREVARFHATCEWFGPGWTVVLSPLVHVVRRPAWDDT